ncbi:MAG: CDP-alcohol phosphatidyltransferase family protein [Desulfobacteraceae bacterium]|nr:CDP-alcohol phosphatidyltransferase family protein [Desulfobacteraceae bacterium]
MKKIMLGKEGLLTKITPVLVYGRPLLVFAGLLCAIAVMLNRSPMLYLAGTILFFASMVLDLADGWFSARFATEINFAELAERVMDRLVYSIVFPLVAVGSMWRLHYVIQEPARLELLHAVFVLIVCVTVLIRDNFAHFMRGFAIRQDREPELQELTRLRTGVAAPLGLLLYVHAFHIPAPETAFFLYRGASWLASLPVRHLFVIEIVFLIINFGSIAVYCRKYGTYCLDVLCFGDIRLRRKILSILPNGLTVMNAMMGLMGVFFAYQGKMTEAYLFLIGAAVFDKLDGAMARKLGLTEPVPGIVQGRVTFGGVMDDVADAVSFCIAPGWIFYIYLSGQPDTTVSSLLILIAAGIYILAGFARLIYFTLDRSPLPGFFKGLPTPAAALFVIAPLLVLQHLNNAGVQWVSPVAWVCIGVMIVAGLLMNLYRIHYIHIGRFMDRNPWFTWTNLVLMLIFVFTPYFGYLVLLQMLLYLGSPLVTWRVEPQASPMEACEDNG